LRSLVRWRGISRRHVRLRRVRLAEGLFHPRRVCASLEDPRRVHGEVRFRGVG
jgi:hypothetical protein